MPMYVLPYKDFSTQAPYFSATSCFVSASRTYGRSNLAMNLSCEARESGLIPRTTAPAFVNVRCASRKSHASLVQPGVSSFE